MTLNHRWGFALAAAMAVVTTEVRAAILEDFQFNDANGASITAAANSVNASNVWLSQNTAINASVQSGAFRIQKGGEGTPVTGQVGNTLDIANITTGKAWLVVDVSGWTYAATASSPAERVRFGFLDNDPPAANSSTVTAEMNIDRNAEGGIELNGGALGTGSSNLAAPLTLTLVRTTPLRLVLELDKTFNQYSVLYKDGAAAYATLGTGNLGERSAGVLREGRSLRFAFTGTFSDAGEFFDVDRVFVTDVNPVPEASSAALAAAAIGLLAAKRRRR